MGIHFGLIKLGSRLGGCVKIEFVTSTKGRSLIIYTDFSVEVSFEMTFTELSHSLLHGNDRNNFMYKSSNGKLNETICWNRLPKRFW